MMTGAGPALAAITMALLPTLALGQSATGLWRSSDEETGMPRALIRISEQAGEYSGRIEKLFLMPDEPANPTCDQCEGDLKGRPIIGLTIVSGMHREGQVYVDGQILDPESGRVYRSRMVLGAQGRELVVRGYIGAPLFGRSQVWVRAD